MMNGMDILQLILLCAVILLPLGYYLRKKLPMLLQSVRQVLFTPRYLKSEGILRRNTRLQRNTSVTVDRKNDQE
ncbi:cellulose biosynthesis protein BcsF [Hafnia alvei]|jgi:cellulose biosynthesis operon protein BcsF/YhjT|uniref:Celllulose biosynthesis operon protein BcsF/YhjT n=1 Tax=Hafnia alvei FB1 TaxID=1453496 RepID=A0A097R7G7_HAFAL|nr:cellulose biosynthesis protein BcsF [Hafnia alvei]AIU74677.1 celllulose biosynthesis operon protein BcsF/YhjT [Hafnia alvei FB1]KID06559.2 celllulose biosynthesis operon protein BcsF/YhjT [Hafnia alvei]MBW3475934.1 cellulose biosynthesis protein BcsF [Hafnia alvei]MDU3154101.1 cellulose biosynthesis protein BcsF [Hafnia alvei]QBJ35029.1 cellulose biosynthesis protein BcsF [Hafnia alvei]